MCRNEVVLNCGSVSLSVPHPFWSSGDCGGGTRGSCLGAAFAVCEHALFLLLSLEERAHEPIVNRPFIYIGHIFDDVCCVSALVFVCECVCFVFGAHKKRAFN